MLSINNQKTMTHAHNTMKNQNPNGLIVTAKFANGTRKTTHARTKEEAEKTIDRWSDTREIEESEIINQ